MVDVGGGLNTIVCVFCLDEEIFGFSKLKTIEKLGGGKIVLYV